MKGAHGDVAPGVRVGLEELAVEVASLPPVGKIDELIFRAVLLKTPVLKRG